MKLGKAMKHIISASMITIYSVSTFAATIADVSTNHWAYKSIVDVKERGIMTVDNKGQFSPAVTMSYFELSDALAKATGYVDVTINTTIDETFKNQIINNYNNQKATLADCATKYGAWDKRYDQQVAYLLGRGYLNQADLDKFVVSNAGTQKAAIVTKEDLAVFIVRMLGKENTAKSTYTSTGFTDESSITAANRPHVAYLKKLGLINGTGAFSPKTQVSRALCAKMISDALKYKEGLNSSTDTTTNNVQTETVTIKKILTKNTSEYYMLLQRGENSSYYTIKNTVAIKDANGNAISIVKVPLQSQAKVTIQLENNTEYITSMQLIATNNNTNSNVNNNTNTDTSVSTTTISATLTEQSSNSIVRLTLTDGTIKAYVLDANCSVTLDGKAVSADEIAVGDKIVATVNGSSIVKLVATTNTSNSNQQSAVTSSGELVQKILTTDGYIFTIKVGSKTSEIKVPSDATITRNGKATDINTLRIGDQIKFQKSEATITEVVATGQTSSIEGTVSSIYLSVEPEITVKTENGSVTYRVAADVEIYDNNKKEYISLRDIHLGQSVEVLLNSKEAVAIDITKSNTSVSYKGKIIEVGKGCEYINVLVDYDPISGLNQVVKRIETPISLPIYLDGKEEYRSNLEEDMDIVVYYEYLDVAVPQKILIIK